MLTLSSSCIPELCASGCCATEDTCASDQSGCHYCNPITCTTGCCVNNRCASKASDCGTSDNLVLIFALVASFLAIVGIILLACKCSKQNVDRARVSVESQEAEKAEPGAVVIVPIVEVETMPNLPTETGELKENEDKSVRGEEINNSMFMKHMKEDRQAQEQYRTEVYNQYEEQGEKPKKFNAKEFIDKPDPEE